MKARKTAPVALGLVLSLTLGLTPEVAPAASRVDDARLSRAAEEPQNWLAHAGAYPDWYYSALAQINATNVHRLRPAWVFELDTSRGQESTPLVVDGTLYVTTAWSKVFALDARTGSTKWKFDPKVPGPAGYKSCCDVVNRGPAVYLDKVYISTIDGRLIALDADTGVPAWSVQTVGPGKMYAITGAPRVMQGKVIVGNSGGEMGARGFVSAYDASSGALRWRFYTVPGGPGKAADGAASDSALDAIARPSWRGNSYEAGGGGQVWNAITLDPRFGQLYIGTANPFPWNPRFRSAEGGDDLFTDSIVALDANTGRYRWHYQEVPNDAWDYDAAEDMILVNTRIRGKKQSLLMQAAKDGFFYVLDRRSGKLLSAAPFVGGITWARGIDRAGRPQADPRSSYTDAPFTVSPGPAGAHSWRPTSYNPLTGLVYIPASETSFRFIGTPDYRFTAGVDDLGIIKGGPAPLPAAAAGSHSSSVARSVDYLLAWNPLAQRRVWRVATTGGGGILSTGGNLVFQGQHRNETAGELVAYRADTGARLWGYSTPNAFLTGPIAYRIGDEEYLAVVTGAGGSADLISRGSNSVLLPSAGKLIAFKLDGTAMLSPDAPPAPMPRSVSGTQKPEGGSEEAIRDGSLLYARYCSRCHARDLRSHNVIPDLRRAAAATDASAWKAIVLDGALEGAGMIGWRRFLSESDAEQIRAYVTAEARHLSTDPQ
jgi:quinohemoprotein ethanol dehydrogenase